MMISPVLNAFSDNRQPEALGEVDHGADNFGAAGVALHRQHERPVDLDLVEVEFVQAANAGIPGTEVIQRYLDADVLKRDDSGERRGLNFINGIRFTFAAWAAPKMWYRSWSR